MKKNYILSTLMALIFAVSGYASYSGRGTFNLISSSEELTDGYYVIATATAKKMAMNNTNEGSFFKNTEVTLISEAIIDPENTIVWKIEKSGDYYTIYNEASEKYVSLDSPANSANASATADANNQKWSFSVSNNLWTIKNLAYNTRMLQYNISSPRFACYTSGSGQTNPQLYKMKDIDTETPYLEGAPENIDFSDVLINTISEATFDIYATNIKSDLTLSISDNSLFSVSPETISQPDGKITITVTFAPTAYGAQEGTLIISGGGVEPINVQLSGSCILPALESAENIVSNVTKTSIDLSWDAVPSADSYTVEIIKQGEVIATEEFEGCIAGSTNASPNNTNIASSLSKYIADINGNPWTGTYVYQAGGAIKLGSSNAKGSITTPALDLSGNNGDVFVTFDAMAWSGDQTSIYVSIDGENKVEVTGLSNTTAYTMGNFTVQLTGGTENSTITFEGKMASSSRFFLDNIEIYSGNSPSKHIEGSPFTTTEPSITINGLTPNTDYAYNIIAMRNADGAEAETGYTLIITEDLETVEMPILSHGSGHYSESISVEITCSTEGAEIWYTLDNGNINLYTEPINISVNTVLYAYATKEDMNESEGAVAEYTFTSVGINNQLNSLQKLFVNNGVLNIENAQVGSNYAIFNSIGAMITYGTMNNSSLEYTLPAKGTYFVKIENTTTKVVF